MAHVETRPGRPGFYGVWKDASGHRIRAKLKGVATRKEAEKMLHELEHRAERQRRGLEAPAPTRVPTITEIAEQWRDHLLTRRRPATWKTYHTGLRCTLTWLAQRARARGQRPPTVPQDVTLKAIRAYATHLLEHGAAPRTVDIYVGALKAMFNWASGTGPHAAQPPLIEVNPLAGWHSLRGPQTFTRDALTTLQIAQLLAHSPEPYRSIWRVFLGTGLRCGELTALAWQDVNLAAFTLTVQATTSKSNRPRTIPLREDAAAVLRRLQRDIPRRKQAAAARLHTAHGRVANATSHKAHRLATTELQLAEQAMAAAGRLVFVNSAGGPWRHALVRRLKPCLRAAGLPPHIDVHTLRHTFGSHALDQGNSVVTVASLMGHASPTVTMNVYAHVLAGRERQAVESLPIPPDGRPMSAQKRGAM